MRILIRKMLVDVLGKERRKQLKRLEFILKRQLTRLSPPLTRDELRDILVDDLGLSEGSTVMVHGGISLLNTQLSAEDIRDLILEVIGSRGHLVVPTFSAVPAIEYMLDPAPFDVRNSRSGMGAIAETVRMTRGARRSLHPTKSVAAIGPEAAALCVGHENCVYPFGKGSPFERLLESDVRIIGIGVPLSYLSFVHVAEDMYPERVRYPIWAPGILQKSCHDGLRTLIISTRVHDMNTMARADPAKFCRMHLRSDQFTILRRRSAPFFAVQAQALHQAILRGFDEGFSIYD